MTQTQPAPPAEEAVPHDVAEAAHDDHGEGHEHPSDRQYVKIALILGGLTALEVFTYFESVHNLGDAAIYVILIVLMVLKFIYVVAWFMHLKFDSVLFKRIFVAGIVLALGVYLVMLTAFRIWGA
ncbi:MAG: cytochrome C oxidase subunit IV family protein [bacterium]|nr:cytochrome C oxidase subunit IV family protein [bacterium]